MRILYRTLNIFCDESHPMENDGCSFFVLGCSHIDKLEAQAVQTEINTIKAKYGYDDSYEIKWSKINGKNLNLICEIVNYVKSRAGLGIRVVVGTNKDESEFALYASHEGFYSGLYYVLLSKLFELDGLDEYNDADIYFDVRNTKSDDNAKRICKGYILI